MFPTRRCGTDHYGRSGGYLCYLGVLALGLARLLKFRPTIPTIFAGCLAGVICTDTGALNNFYLANASRFGLMFAAGALVYQLRHRLPRSGGLSD